MREKQINSLQQRLLNSHNLFEGDITFFDGHIQGITYEQFKQYQPDTNDANMLQTQLNNNMIVEEELNIDVLAYYISPHVSQEDFGTVESLYEQGSEYKVVEDKDEEEEAEKKQAEEKSKKKSEKKSEKKAKEKSKEKPEDKPEEKSEDKSEDKPKEKELAEEAK